VNLVGELQKQGVQFKSLTDAIDTGTASGRFFFHVMASLAEMERNSRSNEREPALKLLANSDARAAGSGR
jgi:DNA invertase Pin-like site-specific DNA recombinase